MCESSACHSGSAQRLPPPEHPPTSLCFIFLHSYYHTCYCMMYLCGYLFPVCLPTECKPLWQRLSILLLLFPYLENSIWHLVDLCLYCWTDGKDSSPASPCYCQKASPPLSAPFFPSPQEFTTSLPQTSNTNLRGQVKKQNGKWLCVPSEREL